MRAESLFCLYLFHSAGALCRDVNLEKKNENTKKQINKGNSGTCNIMGQSEDIVLAKCARCNKTDTV